MSVTDLHPLGSLTTWLSGGTPNRAVREYWTGTVPWISASTLKKFEVCGSDQHVTPAAVRTGSKMAPLGSTLLLVRGSALHSEIRASLVTAPVCFNQDVKALVPDTRVHPRFLTHSLRANSERLLKLVTSAGNTAGVLDTAVTQRLTIWLPTREVQTAIVETLDDVENLISTLERLIAKEQAIKQGMLQQLLTGRTRLPGFDGEWQRVGLGSIAKMGSGGTPLSAVAKYYGGGIPWVSIADMTTNGKYIRHTGSTLTEDGLAASSANLYGADVVLYAMYASLGECSLAVGRVSSSQAILGISVGPQLDREFLYYYLQSIKERVKLLGQQGTQSNLNAGMVRRFEIPLPGRDEQNAISKTLIDSDAEIATLQQRLAKTRAIKQGMMQELLTGRTRLPGESVS
jgi:type I restriction enzyme S subunit